MAGKERLFYTGSKYIIGDPRPSGLDMRVYAVVSLHDGMSLFPGKNGRGCYASFATLTAQLGCDAANLSRSLKRLVDWGYLTEERQEDGRRKTYRVTWDNSESWQSRQQSDGRNLAELPTNRAAQLSKSTTNRPKVVGNGVSLNGRKQSEISEHYSSLKELDLPKEETKSSKGKLNSEESALRALLKVNEGYAPWVNIRELERALQRGSPVDRIGWCVYLHQVEPGTEGLQAVLNDLIKQMPNSEHEEASKKLIAEREQRAANTARRLAESNPEPGGAE